MIIEYSKYMSKPLGPAQQWLNPEPTEESRLGHHYVKTVPANKVLEHFTFSRKEGLQKLTCDVWKGAKNFASKGWKIGAVAGGTFALASNLAAGIGFPPSVLALAVTTAIGAVQGAIVGLATGALLGAAVHGAKSAMYLCKSPEQRMEYAIKKSRKKLEKLALKETSRRRLTNKELQDKASLLYHLPIWEGAANHFRQLAGSSRSNKPEKGMSESETVPG